MTVAEAHSPLITEESEKLLDQEALTKEAMELAENQGIVFLDEIDKVASRAERGGCGRQPGGRSARPAAADRGHDGVDQVRAGEDRPRAVHRLGRLPRGQALRPAARAAGAPAIRVELKALTREDFRRILTEPEANLIRQNQALMKTEDVTLDFTDDAIDALADAAWP
jgi:ATP-dependent HslUV protease ATP-binding subunit HslU